MYRYDEGYQYNIEEEEKGYRGDMPDEERHLPLPKKVNCGIVIDKLKICYEAANGMYLEDLETVQLNGIKSIAGFYFHRMSNDRFKHFFLVYDIDGKAVATLKFNKYANESSSSKYIFLDVNNEVLYDHNRLHELLLMPEGIGVTFHNFTSIDLAYDTPFNTTTQIRKRMRDESLDTIINGKVVKDRSTVLDGLTCTHSITMNRLKNPTITIKQKKAQKHTNEGVTVQAYNKKEEIKNTSDKQYIMDYWGNPTRLYRLEVRLNSEDIKTFLSHAFIAPSIDILYNPSILKGMFLFHLNSVIRFRSGRKIIAWEDILKMQC